MRKRPRPRSENAKSTSPRSLKMPACSPDISSMAVRSQSAALREGKWDLVRLPLSRM
jgi:hypothetical protein